MKNIEKIALASAHVIMDTENIGWQPKDDPRILLLQGDDHDLSYSSKKFTPLEIEDKCNFEIRNTMQMLSNEIGNLDLAVVFLHSDCAECGVKIAKELGLPASKILFAFCECSRGKKMELLEEYGYKGIFEKECGGTNFMKKKYLTFLKTGQLNLN